MQTVHGLGPTLALQVCEHLGFSKAIRLGDVTAAELRKIHAFVEQNYYVEGELKKIVATDIERLKRIRCYRGLKHLGEVGPVEHIKRKGKAKTKPGVKIVKQKTKVIGGVNSSKDS